MDIPDGQHRNQCWPLIIFFAAKDGEALYNQQKQDWELTVAQTMNSFLRNSDWNWRKWGKPLDHSVQFSCSVMSDSLRPHELQHARPPCPSPTPGMHSESRPLSQWCHPAISSSVIPFFSCPQSLPASESFPMSQLFAWGGQSWTHLQVSQLQLSVLLEGRCDMDNWNLQMIEGWFPLCSGIVV